MEFTLTNPNRCGSLILTKDIVFLRLCWVKYGFLGSSGYKLNPQISSSVLAED